VSWWYRMARDSSRATLVCIDVRIVGRKDESQTIVKGKVRGLCAKKTRDAMLGLDSRVLGL